MALLDVVVPGDPAVKGRPRFGKNGHAFTDARTKLAEKYLAGFFRDEWGPAPATTEKVGLAVEFFCATRRRCDGDNLMKLVTDSMNKLVLADDSQIEEWFCRVHRGVGAAQARTRIVLYALEDVDHEVVDVGGGDDDHSHQARELLAHEGGVLGGDGQAEAGAGVGADLGDQHG